MCERNKSNLLEHQTILNQTLQKQLARSLAFNVGSARATIESVMKPVDEFRRAQATIEDEFRRAQATIESVMKPVDEFRRAQATIEDEFRRAQATIESVMKPVDEFRRAQATIESVMKPTLDWQKQLNLLKETQARDEIAKIVKFGLDCQKQLNIFRSPQASLGFPYIIRGGLSVNPSGISTPVQHRASFPWAVSGTITDEMPRERISEVFHTPLSELSPQASHKVLILCRHDTGIKNTVARFVERFGFKAIILNELPNGGRTRIEKLEAYANVDFVITVLTPEDVGAPRDNSNQLKSRACQDIIFEHAFLCNKLGRKQVCILCKGEVEDLPSYISESICVPIDRDHRWKLYIATEMKHAGLLIDLNKLLSGPETLKFR